MDTSNTTQHECNPRDYTQDQINAGQRKINYALTQADKALVEVLAKLKEAIQAPPGQQKAYADQICQAIDAATKAINQVSSIEPPGCDPTWQPPGSDETWKPPGLVAELDENGWPIDFFERVAGSMPDLQRASQGEFEERRAF